MKSTILLTTALFLASAPAPDAKTISEMSGGFLSVKTDYSLMASEDTLNKQFNSNVSRDVNLHHAAAHHSTDNNIESVEKTGINSQAHAQVN